MADLEADVPAPTEAPTPPAEAPPAAEEPWMTGAQLIVFTQANQER
jgi:hypothetical protein